MRYHTAVVILPTLDARDITLWADPIIENRFDNLLEGFCIGVHRRDQIGEACIALYKQGHHHFNLLVGLNLIKPWVYD